MALLGLSGGGGLAGFSEEGDEDALDDKFLGGNEVGEVGVFGAEEGFAALEHVALKGGFAIDECGDNVAFAGFAAFEDNGVAVADVGVDHGFAADMEGKGLGAWRDAECGDVDGDGTLAFGFDVLGHAGGNVAVDGDVDDFAAIEFVRKDDGAGLAGDALDHTFAFEGAQVAHGGGLAGKAEGVLDLAGGGHDAGLALGLAEVIEDFLLAVGEVVAWHGRC